MTVVNKSSVSLLAAGVLTGVFMAVAPHPGVADELSIPSETPAEQTETLSEEQRSSIENHVYETDSLFLRRLLEAQGFEARPKTTQDPASEVRAEDSPAAFTPSEGM
jgi:hypothetical protein